ncbi:(S)-ureidoglycine aminohydrolase [Algisphaera agarilytica]|uniref:(S)-ureidoglycine aminohydrolase n=1 Tax=Algisphaera agarilytica TaxID=1385975 RepID=A0A7X0LKE9_9BACT|nr:(S)-ureidoglycine aminohydrolase [Algisphaera agarilytica]MBB6429571.1 (S)-ureidoglycine aminohydrolase [Algisphaera agarilytica]
MSDTLPRPEDVAAAKQHPAAQTRTLVSTDYAVIAPDGHVVAPLVGWNHTSGVVLISPSMGSAPRQPRFTQTLVQLTDKSTTTSAAPGVQRFVYVLSGKVRINGQDLTTDGYAWLPPDVPHDLQGVEPGSLLVFEQPYSPLPGTPAPDAVFGQALAQPAEPFMGDQHARLAHLLPDETDARFDFAVNRFTFDPGTPLPFVETHHNEHGLYLQHGQGVYRLGSGPTETWSPITAGDSIWMAAYCPQWFVATGDTPATYLYSKNVNRDPR